MLTLSNCRKQMRSRDDWKAKDRHGRDKSICSILHLASVAARRCEMQSKWIYNRNPAGRRVWFRSAVRETRVSLMRQKHWRLWIHWDANQTLTSYFIIGNSIDFSLCRIIIQDCKNHSCNPDYICLSLSLTPDLGLSFGHVINSRGPQLEETLLPVLLAVFFEVQHPLQVRNDDGRPAKVLLQRQRRHERRSPTVKHHQVGQGTFFFLKVCVYLHQYLFVFIVNVFESFLVLFPQIKRLREQIWQWIR